MDFHGSYQAAVRNLRNALHLHRADFARALGDNPHWASEGVEGPNIANAFKRTFYQMLFKFQIGQHPDSAGCAFAVPRAVWDSWQPHFGAPELVPYKDGTWRLKDAEDDMRDDPPAWIYIFDISVSASTTPNQLTITKVIGTSAASLSHYAFDVAPIAAIGAGGSVDRLVESMREKLRPYLPELA
jgi:hypothetical protein